MSEYLYLCGCPLWDARSQSGQPGPIYKAQDNLRESRTSYTPPESIRMVRNVPLSMMGLFVLPGTGLENGC